MKISQATMDKQVNLEPEWQSMLHQNQNKWDLCHAALLVAAQLQPGLDTHAYEHKLDAMLQEIRDRSRDLTDLQARIGMLNDYFYKQQGFAGDRENYYSPENSLIDKVIDRRLGIPITLAILYIRLAQGAGLDAYGIGFPGHYLVGVNTHEPADEAVIIDPFDAGKELTPAQLRSMLQQATLKTATDIELESNLQPASKAETVVRMLRNLKQIYIETQEVEFALACIEMILSIFPESPDELRDRGMIYQHIEYAQGAIADLTHYLKLVPDAEERNVIEALIDSLQAQNKSLH